MQKERTTERKEAAASAKEKNTCTGPDDGGAWAAALAFGDISDAVRLIFGPPGSRRNWRK
ncbi:MAG: hypothetical protein ACLSB9_08735 [Hydrogeniiclostridium mannosilyticum]